MALTKIDFASGLIKDETALTAEGGYIDANNVRFRQGKPETRGGCELLSIAQFTGISRRQHAWTDLSGQPQLAFGTADKLYAYTGGAIVDITPVYASGTVLNPFSTASGSPTVTVKIAEHGLKLGQSVTFSHAAAVGGLTLNSTYTVSRLVTRDTFEITAGSNATSTVANGGGGVDYVAALPPGLADGVGGLGYGVGTYGSGAYGLPSIADFLPTVWSLDNFGETLLAVRRGGPLYAWQPATSYPEILLDSTFAGGTGWATATRGGTKTAGTAANLSQNIQNAVTGGYTYRAVVTVTGVTAGTARIQINAGTPTPAVIDVGSASTPITANGTYSRLIVMPANATDLVVAADASFAGTVTVSLKLESKAFIVPEAPRRNDSMLVDPHRVVCLFGTYEADGDYNPLLARWSDRENYRTWIPDTNNFAGEISVSSGGRIVRAIASRSSNLIWTDASLHGMQFTTDGFSVSLIASGVGALGINAVVEHQGIAYWWSNNGNPYRTTFDFQGAIPQMIDCRIRKDVFDNIAPAQAEKVYGCVNGEFSEIQFLLPDARISTECNTAAVYNFAENHWTSWRTDRSSWVPAGVFVSPVACGTDGYLYYEERGVTNNGMPVPNFLQTGYFDVEDGGNLMQIMGLVYDFARSSGAIRFYVSIRPFPHGPERTYGPFTTSLTPTAGSYRDQKLDFRTTGRQMALRLEAETPWRLGTLRAFAQKSGAVR